MSMAMMVAMASRKRDDHGRYAGGNDDRRMGYDEPEMRRARDSRGRYMDGGESGNTAHYIPHLPPYGDVQDMREGNVRPGEERRGSVWMHDEPRQPDNNIIKFRDYQDRRRIGFAGDDDDDDDDEEFGREQAEAWVHRMHGDDPQHPDGPKWTPEQVKPFAQRYGFPTDGEKFWQFFAVMNAMYADNYETAKEFGVVRPEFFASLAKAWLKDKDAVEDKISAYVKHVVRK